MVRGLGPCGGKWQGGVLGCWMDESSPLSAWIPSTHSANTNHKSLKEGSPLFFLFSPYSGLGIQ